MGKSTIPSKPIGRPKKYSKYVELRKSLSPGKPKRPKYVDGIGWYLGTRGEKVFLKIRLRHGGTYNGKTHPKGSSLEIPLGEASSWAYEQLEDEFRRLQGLADRDEPLEATAAPIFSEWAGEWLKRAEARLRSFQTIRAHVNLSFNPMFGSIELGSITTLAVNFWIKKRLTEAKPATVKRELSTLTTILNDAIKSGLLEKNPCANSDKIKGVVGRQRFLSSEEMVILLVKAEKAAEWLPDFILWCIHSGMRRGEVLGIKWSDVRKIDNERTIITLEKTKSDQPRQVICTQTMKEVLGRQRGRIQYRADSAVFSISKMKLRRRWEEARRLANLSDVTIHDLRRTHSTYAASAGVDLKTLAARIGHTDLTMLEKHYAALVGSAAAEAAKTIQRTFDELTAEGASSK
jgi:integrase